jgi:predicted RNase H-like HicB family nuclease
MPTRNYIAVADRAPGEAMWSIVFPDFPGVTSAAAEFADVPQQACDALATAVEDIIAEGERLPTSVEEGRQAEADLGPLHDPRYIVVPVEVPEQRALASLNNRNLLQKMEIKVLTTDEGFVAGLNSAGIEGIHAQYRPTMAYDSAEHICEIVITAIGSLGLRLAGDWIIARWKNDKPTEASINNQIVSNAEQVTVIVNNFIEKQEK